jgi:hypothetical protein
VKLQEARDLVARLEAEYNAKESSAAKVGMRRSAPDVEAF